MDKPAAKPSSSSAKASSFSRLGGERMSAGRNSSGGDGIASSSKTTASRSVPDLKPTHSIAPTVSTPSSTSSPPDTTDMCPARVLTQKELTIILDMITRECANIRAALTPKPQEEPDDPPCVVCDDPLDDTTDNIVFCDGCDMAVHQSCYGVPTIPDDQWFCKKCELSPKKTVECVFCLRSLGGAFKKTDRGDWAHVLCAEFVPETAFDNDTTREPVIGTERALQVRAKIKGKCAICKVHGGAPIQCAEQKCCVPFHVTCARDRGWLESMASEGPTVLPDRAPYSRRAWCDKHIPDLLVQTFQDKREAAEKAAKARRNASRSGNGVGDDVCADVTRQLEKLLGRAINDDLQLVGRISSSHRTAPPLARPQPTAINPLKRSRSIDSSDDSSMDDSSDEEDGHSPAPKRIKSTHAHPADQIVDLEMQLESVHSDLRDSKAEIKRLKATDRAKDAEITRKDLAISRLGASLADLQAIAGSRSSSTPIQEADQMPFCEMPPFTEFQEAVISRRIRREMRPYGPAMASLEYHVRMNKHWEKEMERTEGFFKDKIALEKQLEKARAESKKADTAHTEEMDSLLIPYDGAYWAIYSTLRPEAKVAKLKAHLKEMTSLATALDRSWDEPEPQPEPEPEPKPEVISKEREPLAPVAVNVLEGSPPRATKPASKASPRRSLPPAPKTAPTKEPVLAVPPPRQAATTPVRRRVARTFDAPLEINLEVKVILFADGAEITVTTLNNVDRMSTLEEVYDLVALRMGCPVEDVVLTMKGREKPLLRTIVIDQMIVWARAEVVGYRKDVYEQVQAEERARDEAARGEVTLPGKPS